MAEAKKKRDGFGSKIGIIAAAAGSAIGLGNIYRFPCEVGNNGGAAFLLVYLAVVIFLGIPVMLSELVIGRRSQSNSVGAFKKLSPKTAWPIVGYLGVLCGFLIFAFYSTVSGWTLEYIVKSVTNSFQGKDLATVEQEFADFHDMGWRNVMWQAVFVFLTGFVVFKGVQNGIERYAKILMPLLLVILVVLGIRSMTLPGAREGLSFLFKPDFSKITGKVLVSALGQGFFSLSLGMGVLITYGSYVKRSDNLTSTASSVVLADTLIAILAGLVIFPAAFSFGIKPEAGMGLVFNTLPMLFNRMAGGYWFCLIFFCVARHRRTHLDHFFVGGVGGISLRGTAPETAKGYGHRLFGHHAVGRFCLFESDERFAFHHRWPFHVRFDGLRLLQHPVAHWRSADCPFRGVASRQAEVFRRSDQRRCDKVFAEKSHLLHNTLFGSRSHRNCVCQWIE